MVVKFSFDHERSCHVLLPFVVNHRGALCVRPAGDSLQSGPSLLQSLPLGASLETPPDPGRNNGWLPELSSSTCPVNSP